MSGIDFIAIDTFKKEKKLHQTGNWVRLSSAFNNVEFFRGNYHKSLSWVLPTLPNDGNTWKKADLCAVDKDRGRETEKGWCLLHPHTNYTGVSPVTSIKQQS